MSDTAETMTETPPKPSVAITVGGKERLEDAVRVITPEFMNEHIFKWQLYHMSEEKHNAYLPTMLHGIIKAALLGGAQVYEADGWSSCCILIPPGKKVDGTWPMIQSGIIPMFFAVGVKAIKRIAIDYLKATEKSKAGALTPEERKKYWYVYFIATSSERRRQGLASAIIRRTQEEARKDGRPMWLEATSLESRAAYAKQGYQIVDEIVLGKGEVGSDGRAKPGGEGITIWSMIWRPGKDGAEKS